MPGGRSIRGYFAAASAPFMVGLGVAASSVLVRYPAFASQGARYFLGSLIILLVFRSQVRLPAGMGYRDLFQLALLTLVGLVIFSSSTIEALRYASVAGVGVIVGCVPLVLTLSGLIVERRRPTAALLGGVALATSGAIVVNGVASISGTGIVFALIAMLSDAAFSLLAARLVEKTGPVPLAFATNLAAGATMLFMALLLPHGDLVPTASQATAIVFTAVAVSFGSFVLWYSGLASLGVARAGVFVALIPVGALAGQLAVGGRPIEPLQLLGVAAVAAGLVLAIVWGRESSGPQLYDRLDLDGST